MSTEKDAKLKALQLTLDKLDKTYGKGTVMKMGDKAIEEVETIEDQENIIALKPPMLYPIAKSIFLSLIFFLINLVSILLNQDLLVSLTKNTLCFLVRL
jgi:hypothetical protein